jgi:hypothetical protein
VCGAVEAGGGALLAAQASRSSIEELFLETYRDDGTTSRDAQP